MSAVSEIRDPSGELIAILSPAAGMSEDQIQQQVRAARSRVEFIVAERQALARYLVQHIPSSGEDRFNCLCGQQCPSAADWATHAAAAALMPDVTIG